MAFDSELTTTVVFDLVGTLVDEIGTLRSETTSAFDQAGLNTRDGEAFADGWRSAFGQALTATVAGRRPWQRAHQLRHRTLLDSLDAAGIALEPKLATHLAGAGRRLQPWPDADRQLAAILHRRPTCTLTNASYAETLETSQRGNLQWHAVLCTELARTYKPDPGAYELAIDQLELNPRRTLFVAAHGWDLSAARARGFQTAYLPRPHAQGPENVADVDVNLGSLDELIGML